MPTIRAATILTAADADAGERDPSGPTAILFPGQGSQDRTMREQVDKHCGALLAAAVADLGADPFDHLRDGTLYLQPAVYCATIARWRAMGEPLADYAAGHSLGEIAALVAAGCLDPDAGLQLVLTRGRLMQSAADDQPPGGLLALIGPRANASQLAAECELSIALDNEPTQLVIAGTAPELEQARRLAAGHGLRTVLLRVPAALHSPAMASAAHPFRKALEHVEFAPPQMIVLANVTAKPFQDIRDELVQALTHCVRFREIVLALQRDGVESYLEVGSRATLTGLVERTLDDETLHRAG
jgi:[acyl-carrier-protein] S-malonyltransferase